jgi:hypothetical protein
MAGNLALRPRAHVATAVVVAVAALVALVSVSANAAAPTSGTLQRDGDTVSWSGASEDPQVNYKCTGPDDPACDTFRLTLAHTGPFDLTIEITTTVPAEDWDLKVYAPNGDPVALDGINTAVAEVPNPGLATVLETATIREVQPGTYTIVAQPYLVGPGSTYSASATLVAAQASRIVDGSGSTATAPTYLTYPAPPGLADGAGEPSIGWTGPARDAVMFQARELTSEVHWDDTYRSPIATWTPRRSPLNSSFTTLDPILATDPVTGRTYVSQLLLACSGASYSDDAGVTWSPSTGCPLPNGADHQTVGFGPARPGSLEASLAPGGRVAYYCSQQVVTAFCGTSIDGGRTFGVATPVFSVLDGCTAFHGHVKVGPDGTVYLPNERCNGQLLARSEDNGKSWSTGKIPDFSGVANLTHPSVAVSNAGPRGPAHGGGVVYYANGDSSNRLLVAVSDDRGATWGQPIEVARPLGLKAVEFPVVIAGDPDRAAVAFFGTKDDPPGDYSDVGYGEVDGTHTVSWHLYVSHTYDRGRTWRTVDVTGADPTQRGCLWNRGTTNDAAEDACRNLLDFNGIASDARGRVLIGWADGCTGPCVTSAAVADDARTQLGTISRQTTGLPLLSAYDRKIGLGTKKPPGAVCSGTDPSGDATVQGATPSQDGLDVVSTAVAQPRGVGPYTFDIGVKDLGAPTAGGLGTQFDWAFDFGGGRYTLAADREPVLGEVFTLTGPDGSDVPGVSGTFSDTDDRVRVVVPEVALTPAADGARTMSGSLVRSIASNDGAGLILDRAFPCDRTFVVERTRTSGTTRALNP